VTVVGSARPAVLPLGHRTGYKPDAASKRGLLALSHTLFGDCPAFPPSSSSEALEGDILDQNETSSCTGHGTSQALEVAAKKAGIPLPFRASPRGIYDNARVAELSAGQGLADEGAEPIDVVAAIAAKGIRALVMPSPQGYASDCDSSNVDVPPTAAELQAERAHLELGAFRIDVTRAAWIDQLCAAIDKHGAACTGSFVDSAFEAYTPATGPVQTVNMQDPQGGAHWLAVTSYRTVTEGSDDAVKFGIAVGKRVIRGPNSWTKNWGDNGHYEVVAEDVLTQSCSDCYGFVVQSAVAPSRSLLDRIIAAVKAAL
jgi:hypothetical protein